MVVCVDDLRNFLRKPLQVWSRGSDNLRLMVTNYGNPRPHQVHKLRLIMRLEKSTRKDFCGNNIWNKLVSWVDCTYLGDGDISDLDNWSFNSGYDELRLMLAEVGVNGALVEYERYC